VSGQPIFHSWAVQKRRILMISDISKRHGKYSIRDQRVMSHMNASFQYIRKTKIQMTILCVWKETERERRALTISDIWKRDAETNMLYSSSNQSCHVRAWSMRHVTYVPDQCVMSRTYVINASCHVRTWSMRHVTYVRDQCVMSRTYVINESCHLWTHQTLHPKA